MKVVRGIDLLPIADEGVREGRKAGADEVEVFVTRSKSTSVSLQKNDVKGASTEEETVVGVRVFVNKAMGFATINDARRIARVCEEAVALARVAPADEKNGLAEPRPIVPVEGLCDPVLLEADVASVVDVAAEFLDLVRTRDKRVNVDSGSVSVDTTTRAIATSRGIRASEDHAHAGGSLFGMAVDGADVGSFDYDGDTVRRADDFRTALSAAAERFVIKTLGGLGTQAGESFSGAVILSPEVVAEFLLANLLSVLSAKAVRLGRSPFAKRIGEKIAHASLSVIDDPRDGRRAASVAFDREGQPTVRRELISNGVLNAFLYDAFEARSADTPASSGNARGSAAGLPSIGPWNLIVPGGTIPFARLCSEPPRAVLVSRFSGTSNPVTGEFSGVVKGGFLLRGADRVPIKEVQIAGSLYDAIQSISGLSKETRLIEGTTLVPAVRIENVSITAG